MKVIVVGGGASGLVSAIFASMNGNEVTILERNSFCGKKILVTGNGKCNYWNVDQDISHYHSTNLELLSKIVTPEIQEKVLAFFDTLGIVPKIKNGYYYPYSNQATSIQTALILQAQLSGVKFVNNVYVQSITKENNIYNIETSNGIFLADRVIMATGSKASPKTGSDGNGYNLITRLGHSIIKPLPALVQLNGDGKHFKDWAGIRQDVTVRLIEDDHFVREETGEIILTDYGISGICVMQLSRMVAKGLEANKSECILINFVPWLTSNENEFIEWMNVRTKRVKRRTVRQLLDGILNYKLVNLMVKESKIDSDSQWQELNANSKLLLAKNIVSFEQKIISTHTFDKAQVCSGGVPLTEINPHTMESLKNKGLYIIGELLDVDGDCGGYNLGFAWISGILAGNAITKGE